MGISASASFRRVRKSLYAASARTRAASASAPCEFWARYNGALMTITTGTKLGPYEVQSPLGAGGMGEVYRARDSRLDRTVAIKVLSSHHSSDPALRQRFEREARTISKFSHPNICTLYDIGNHDGLDYLVMEYIEGESLEQRLTKGPVPPAQAM